MTVRDDQTAKGQVIPRTRWHFVDSGTVALDGGFEPGRIYDVVYQSADPRVLGCGLSGTRDLVSFLKYDTSSDNPTPGIRYATGWGVPRRADAFCVTSVSGLQRGRAGTTRVRRRLRSGRRRGARIVQPPIRSGVARRAAVLQHPVSGGPVSVHRRSGDDPKAAPPTACSGARSARAQCRRCSTCSPTRSTSTGPARSCTPIPPERETPIFHRTRACTCSRRRRTVPVRFRRCRTAAAAWSAGTAQPAQLLAGRACAVSRARLAGSWTTCRRRRARIHGSRTVRSRHPIAPAWPAVPGFQLPQQPLRAFHLNFGADWSKGIVSVEPPEVGKPFVVRVPAVDADGNVRAGIRLPDIAVPLATQAGWNYRDASIGAQDRLAGEIGFVHTVRTHEDRPRSRSRSAAVGRGALPQPRRIRRHVRYPPLSISCRAVIFFGGRRGPAETRSRTLRLGDDGSLTSCDAFVRMATLADRFQ